ncbi:neurogenic locus notch protein 1 [Biomphalaria glabrata]|nr:neurogenic locus notch-like protein 1-like [Biomphalaria glabrata]
MEKFDRLRCDRPECQCHHAMCDVQLTFDTVCPSQCDLPSRQSDCDTSTDGLSHFSAKHSLVLTCSLLMFLFVFSPAAVSCQDTVNMCEHNECANSSACVNRSYDYICNCSGTQFTGWFCNVTIQQNCSQSLCQNGGTCTDTIVTINNQSLSSFNCSCRAGYEGPLCEKPVDYCNKDGYKCFNSGKCINNPEYQNYTCNCDNATDFIGPNCSTKVNNCYTNNSCVNGKCIDGINNYTCQCPLGYEGLGCEHQVNMCGNSSFCQRGSCVTNGSCDCTGTGYGGLYCQQEIDECSATVSVCLNGANCTNLEGDYNCSCTEGYTGKNCQTPSCTGIICQNDGTCNIVGSYWQCTCKPYIEGKYCDKIGPCFNNPCRNQATCQQSIEYNNYTCFCLPGK